MSQHNKLTKGPLFKNMILYTIPIILTGILQLLFNSADLVIIGRFRSSDSVGAIGATVALISLITNLFIGISIGTSVIVAQSVGAKDNDRTYKIVHTSIPIAFISGIILTIVGVFGARIFLTIMKTPSESINLATTYLRIYIIKREKKQLKYSLYNRLYFLMLLIITNQIESMNTHI